LSVALGQRSSFDSLGLLRCAGALAGLVGTFRLRLVLRRILLCLGLDPDLGDLLTVQDGLALGHGAPPVRYCSCSRHLGRKKSRLPRGRFQQFLPTTSAKGC